MSRPITWPTKMTGALVVSLDFELRWGVIDCCPPGHAYEEDILGAREAIPHVLELFVRYGIRATWATVGFLFARDADELRQYWPDPSPDYARRGLDPRSARVGSSEGDDPLHFAASLIDRIANTPGQEIGTHTMSHFCALEEGQDSRAFAADIEAAVRIAQDRGIDIRSIVFPRHQVNPEYFPILVRNGILTYRDDGRGILQGPLPRHRFARAAARAARLTNSTLPLAPHRLAERSTLEQDQRLPVGIPSTAFVRLQGLKPKLLDAMHLHRIEGAIDEAARRGRLVHLWWHPHNLGGDLEGSLRRLIRILDRFARARERYGMRSMSMGDLSPLPDRKSLP